MDPNIFPEPEMFNPDRWLNAESEDLMHANLLPFGKGSRACAGQKLALFVLYSKKDSN